MNIKFRMPHIGTKSKSDSVVRELLLTTIATTISIVLTFGGSAYFEQKKKKSDARLMAMMVIHDMENTALQLRQASEQTVQEAEPALYVWENFYRLDDIGEDTLKLALSYIVEGSSEHKQFPLDEASEKIFLSSQETWKNIDNPGFIDAVQHFYVDRHQVFDYINSAPFFRKPISSEEEYRVLANCKDVRHWFRLSLLDRLREFLPRNDVQLYLTGYYGRQGALKDYARNFEQTITKCKFMMGITDEELDTYVKSQEQAGHSPKKSELVGKWYLQKEKSVEVYYELTANHEFRMIALDHVSNPDFTGIAEFTRSETGTWELRDNSLCIVHEPGTKFHLDASNIKANPGKEAETKGFIKYWTDYGAEVEKSSATEEAEVETLAVSIDDTGTKMELRKTYTNKDGKEITSTLYLVKESN